MNRGGAILALSFVAAERVVPGYGGGMSSAKSQLESDMRVLSFELGRAYGLRINTISAGALKSRAASAIGGVRGEKTYIEYCIDYSEANAPLQQDLEADDVGATAAFLCSPRAPRHKNSPCPPAARLLPACCPPAALLPACCLMAWPPLPASLAHPHRCPTTIAPTRRLAQWQRLSRASTST